MFTSKKPVYPSSPLVLNKYGSWIQFDPILKRVSDAHSPHYIVNQLDSKTNPEYIYMVPKKSYQCVLHQLQLNGKPRKKGKIIKPRNSFLPKHEQI